MKTHRRIFFVLSFCIAMLSMAAIGKKRSRLEIISVMELNEAPKTVIQEDYTFWHKNLLYALYWIYVPSIQ